MIAWRVAKISADFQNIEHLYSKFVNTCVNIVDTCVFHFKELGDTSVWCCCRLSIAVLRGGPLPQVYRLRQLHFHWGSSDDHGSEHVVNGVRYAGEVRLTTFYFKTGCKIKLVTIVPVGQNLSFAFQGVLSVYLSVHFYSYSHRFLQMWIRLK